MCVFRSHPAVNGRFWSSPKSSAMKSRRFPRLSRDSRFEVRKRLIFHQLPGYISWMGLGTRQARILARKDSDFRNSCFLKIMDSVFRSNLFSKFGTFWRFRGTSHKPYQSIIIIIIIIIIIMVVVIVVSIITTILPIIIIIIYAIIKNVHFALIPCNQFSSALFFVTVHYVPC